MSDRWKEIAAELGTYEWSCATDSMVKRSDEWGDYVEVEAACKRIAELEVNLRKAEEDRGVLLALLCDCEDFLRSRAPIGRKLRRDIEAVVREVGRE